MARNRFKGSSLAGVLIIIGLIMSGCSDGSSDHFDESSDIQYVQKPTLVILNENEDAMVTSSDSITLHGLSMRAVDVEVDGVSIGVGASPSSETPEIGTWHTELDLVEGENIFELVGVDVAGERSDPLSVSITYDPEYVPVEVSNVEFFNPEYNDQLLSSKYLCYLIWTQNANYDPPGSRPDEMIFEGSVTEEMTPNMWGGGNFLNDIDTTKGHTYIAYKNLNGSQAVEAEASVTIIEHDDGFFTGKDDHVGSGNVTVSGVGVPQNECECFSETNSVNVGPNILKIEVINCLWRKYPPLCENQWWHPNVYGE